MVHSTRLHTVPVHFYILATIVQCMASLWATLCLGVLRKNMCWVALQIGSLVLFPLILALRIIDLAGTLHVDC